MESKSYQSFIANTFKKDELIDFLTNNIREDEVYISSDEFGFTRFMLSDSKEPVINNEMFMRVYKNHENGDYEVFKVKVNSYRFETSKEGRLNCLMAVEPINGYPKWMDNEELSETFSEVLPTDLSDNEFWA